MVGRLFAVGCGLQQIGAASAFYGGEPADLKATRGQGAGLVHDDGVDVGRGLDREVRAVAKVTLAENSTSVNFFWHTTLSTSASWEVLSPTKALAEIYIF